MIVIQRLLGLLPPPARRTISGLWLDLRGLIARVSEPSRWHEPWQTIHNVGGGDYRRTGHELLQLLVDFAALSPRSIVLDVGCGTGRVARPLASYLQGVGSYTGFDVSPMAIKSCRRRFASVRPDFCFVEADLLNSEYRSSGSFREEEYTFPAQDSSVDVVFAFSVFSHMRLSSLNHYLVEAARVLKPEGRFLFTAYLLTDERMNNPEHRRNLDRRFQTWNGQALVMDRRSPERAIAHHLEDVLDGVSAAGLVVSQELRLGAWLGQATYAGAQDLVVTSKRGG